MYIEFSNLGVVSGVNRDIEIYFNELSSFYSNFFELVKNRACCPKGCKRVLKKYWINKAETVTYEYQTKKGVFFIIMF